jgi:uncharacterized protein DUF3592
LRRPVDYDVMAEKKNSRGSLKDLAWGVLMFVGGGLIAITGWSSYRQDARIERSGQRAEGYLTRKNAQVIYESVSYDIEYWFTLPGGERVEASRYVSEGLWSTLHEGEPFVVLYSAADPQQNFPLGGGEASIWTLVVSTIAAIVALVGVLGIVYFFRPQMFDS